MQRMARRRRRQGGSPTGTSRATRPTSAFAIPGRARQVLLRLARRADRLPGVAEELLRQAQRAGDRRSDFDAVPRRADDVEQYPLHRQGHHLLPHAVLAGDAASSPAAARCPTTSSCTASSRVSGEKMSKSRGTGIEPATLPRLGLNPEWLRYYIAAKLNAQRRGHRLQSRRFRRAGQQRPGRQVREHREPRGDVHRAALRRQAAPRAR